MTARRKYAAALALLIIVLVAIGLRATSGSGEDASATPAGTCVTEVMSYLSQVPGALAEGYTGVDAKPLMVDYGMTSVEYETYVSAQSSLVGDILARGSGGALGRIEPYVRQQCTAGHPG